MVTMELDRVGVGRPASTVSDTMDEVLYSRLMHSIGRKAVEWLSSSRVLVLGCRGMGAEVAKNLALSGVASVGLVDEGTVCVEDLGCQMLLKEGDVGSNRAVATARTLRELSPCVDAIAISEAALESSLKDFQLLVVTMGTLPYIAHVNRMCREAGVMLVAAISRGVFSFVFVDLGECFSVLDETGEPVSPVLVEGITQDSPATVTVVEEQRHGLEDGDEVVFSGISGMEELNHRVSYPVTVTGSCSFTIPEDTRGFNRYVSGGYFHKKRPVKKMSFLPMDKSINSPEFCISDPAKAGRTPCLHIAFQAADEYERQHGLSSTGAGSTLEDADAEEVVKLAREMWLRASPGGSLQENGDLSCKTPDLDRSKSGVTSSSATGKRDADSSSSANEEACSSDSGAGRRDGTSGLDEELVKLVAQGGSVEICPIVAITGGIAAQEAIKALSKVFMPVHQWFYFDATECLPLKSSSLEERTPLGSRYDSQAALFGREFQQKLSSSQWLVVGAGGIGSEVLKNLVLMGVGCGTSGRIVMTDMDSVSKANLVDQALYHIDDLDRPKTPTAARALRRINPAAQIHALQEKFDASSESLFDTSFFESMTGVISAVDNSTSRLYIDMRCVNYRRPLIDGGKHGAKGSVQVFVPFQSEMYASTRDPPEHREFPICTLKNFPYAPEHTLKWAVETFEALFKQRPVDVNSYLSKRDFQDSMRKSPASTRLPILETLRDALVLQRPLSFDACVQWARLQFEELFTNNIKQLLYNFPAGMTTSAGTPFWSGTKRIPTPLAFHPSEPLHMDFIIAAANLQATVYGLKGCRDHSLFVDIVQRVAVPHFQPKEGIKIAVSDSEVRNPQRRGQDDSDATAACEAILQELPTPPSLVGYRLTPLEFEKDDEHNFHADFIAAAANLRAHNYGIPLSTKLQARLIGGGIIPAIITSTSVVGGLICLELYKLLLQKPLSDYRHSYFNLAVPLFCFAQPMKAFEHTVARSQGGLLNWTLWDKFEMDCVGMPLESFLLNFKQQQGLEITMVSYGKSLLYAEFLPRKKLQDRFPVTLLDLVTSVGKVAVPPTETKLVFSVSCTDADGNDVEVPDVIVKVR
ncbi:ubiquitin-like modifier-activating enzyme 1 [Selaginella moellendorffii]|uniref:ubiquitin-like modifier-activating enzyme 1 n=1 Tax=Selaginella moellendorffii TaxID=88036 RepID=UPI000D1CFE4A|nr:ubiquitin-like modifier-activating enzyme 1 [Selaginella moellendorffii]|eukprot:XP_024529342.1 ubiquitin-like modifier-activating enzyme 1 [Selaginella moellendorffii]